MKGRFFLNVIVRKSSSILKLLSSENESLLFRRNSFFVLDFCLDILDGVVCFDIQSDGFSGEGLDENLHSTTSKTEDQMKGGFFLNVVVRKSSAILKLFSCKDETLLLRRNSFLVLDLGFNVLDRVICFNVQSNSLSGESLDENLHGTTTETKDKVKGGFLLDVVVRERSAVFELLSCEDETLLFWRNSFLVLDLGFDILDRIVCFNVQSDSLSGEGLDEDLHGTTTKTEDKMKGRFFLNVIVRKSSAILKLLSSENESLLFRRDAFFVLDLRFHVLDCVIGFNVQSDGLSSQGLDEDLHSTTAKTKDKVKGGLFLNVVIRKSSAILELFSGENESLLFRRDAFFILDLRFHILDSVIGFNVQGDSFTGQGLDEDLHGATTKTKDKVKGGLLLNVVIRQCSAVFELLSCEDETLLLWRDSFFVLNLCLHVLNGIICFYVKSDRLSGKRFDKNLHSTTTETEDKMKG